MVLEKTWHSRVEDWSRFRWERSGIRCPDEGTRRASSPSQMSRMQVTSTRACAGRITGVFARTETGGGTIAGCTARQASAGTIACFKSEEVVASGVVSRAGTLPFAQQSAARSAQQCPHFISPTRVAQPPAFPTGPAARARMSVSRKSRRKSIAAKVLNADHTGSIGLHAALPLSAKRLIQASQFLRRVLRDTWRLRPW